MPGRPPDLGADEIARLRLRSLLLSSHPQRTPAEIAQWFGAMQAQDLASGKWSFGVRLPQLSESEIDAHIQSGAVLRTWPMRGTIHFVAATDTRWLLQTTGAPAMAGASRRKKLGLDEAALDRAVEVMQSALRGGRRLSRSDAIATMADSGIPTAGQSGYHLLRYVSQIGLTCIGPDLGKEQSFVLLDDWAPKQRNLTGDEALAELALRFFRGHGPATIRDFAGWSGISMGAARTAVAALGDTLTTVFCGPDELWLMASLRDEVGPRQPPVIQVLPGFDEYLLGYKDRSIPVPEDFLDRVIPGNNGVFQATIVEDGRVIGIWKRTMKRSLKQPAVAVQAMPFTSLSRSQVSAVAEAFDEYARYLNMQVRLTVV